MDTGVYFIVNRKSRTTYVGSAAKSIKTRWRQHKHELRKGKHRNSYLQRSWNKHGEDAFDFAVIEYCTPEECVAAEQRQLDNLKAEGAKLFNINPIAGSMLGYKFSEEARAKLSALRTGVKQSPETVRKRALANTGKKRSEESRQRMSLAQLAFGPKWSEEQKKLIGLRNRGRECSEETRRKLSLTGKGRKRSKESNFRTSLSISAWWKARKNCNMIRYHRQHGFARNMVRLRAKGCTYREIGELYCIDESTVRRILSPNCVEDVPA